MTSKIEIRPIQTAIFRRGENLNAFLKLHLTGALKEGDVLAVTSKICSLAENRVVSKDSISKNELVRKEADVYLGEGGYGVELTVKHGLLIPSGGIDESNSEDEHYILFPEDPYRTAAEIGKFLRTEFNLKDLGVIVTDSHTMPLRMGVTGISLSHWGLRATRSLVGAPDIFGRPLKFTSVDVVDSLAAMAVFMMGEAADRCPLAIISGAAIEFTEKSDASEIAIPLKLDLYYPVLRKCIVDTE